VLLRLEASGMCAHGGAFVAVSDECLGQCRAQRVPAQAEQAKNKNTKENCAVPALAGGCARPQLLLQRHPLLPLNQLVTEPLLSLLRNAAPPCKRAALVLLLLLLHTYPHTHTHTHTSTHTHTHAGCRTSAGMHRISIFATQRWHCCRAALLPCPLTC
jgi:hypothetical protein